MKLHGVHHDKLLKCLSSLPERMLSFHRLSNITEFILYDLCDQECFNLKKAAYFIDNPDFDCFKGIAGFCIEENLINKKERWDDPNKFSCHLSGCNFNQKVRSLEHPSKKRAQLKHEDVVTTIAQHLDITVPLAFSWPMKNDNHGLFVFEANKVCQDSCLEAEREAELDEELVKIFYLLSFCPIY